MHQGEKAAWVIASKRKISKGGEKEIRKIDKLPDMFEYNEKTFYLGRNIQGSITDKNSENQVVEKNQSNY